MRQFEQKIAHTLQNIDEILYSYIYLENDKCFNLFSLFKDFCSFIVKLFTPIKYQRAYISKKRKADAVRKVEYMADHNEEFNKTEVDKL